MFIVVFSEAMANYIEKEDRNSDMISSGEQRLITSLTATHYIDHHPMPASSNWDQSVAATHCVDNVKYCCLSLSYERIQRMLLTQMSAKQFGNNRA